MPLFDRLGTIDYLLKFACTEVSLAMVTLQVVAVPEHAPLQLANVLPAGGVAVSFTTVPLLNFAEQALPQSRTLSFPAGVAVTVPGLLRPTDKVNCVVVVPPPPPPPVAFA